VTQPQAVETNARHPICYTVIAMELTLSIKFELPKKFGKVQANHCFMSLLNYRYHNKDNEWLELLRQNPLVIEIISEYTPIRNRRIAVVNCKFTIPSFFPTDPKELKAFLFKECVEMIYKYQLKNVREFREREEYIAATPYLNMARYAKDNWSFSIG